MYKQATQRTTEALSMPPRWLGMYSDFITKNSSAVSQIESALRSLTYIIPGVYQVAPSVVEQDANGCLGRFRESEIASESRTSCAPLSRNPYRLTYTQCTAVSNSSPCTMTLYSQKRWRRCQERDGSLPPRTTDTRNSGRRSRPYTSVLRSSCK